MPPKKARKTKKQLEEEKKIAEEELRIQKELEEKRLAEEAAKKAIEDEKRRILEAKLAAEEKERLVKEEDSIIEWRKRYHTEIEKVQVILEKERDWDNFHKCNKLPNVYNESELCTHLSWIEITKTKTPEELALYIQENEDIISNMQEIMGESLAEYDYDKINYCAGYWRNLRKVCLLKVGEYSQHVLEHLEDHLIMTEEEKRVIDASNKNKISNKEDPYEKEEANLIVKTKSAKIGILINYQKAKRQRNFGFEELGMKAELPRNIVAQGNASFIFRCIWLEYDYLSPINTTDFVVGGIYTPEMFFLPVVPKKAKKWVIRPVSDLDGTLRSNPYPDPTSAIQNPQPLAIWYTLPPYAYIQETDPRIVCFWDDKNECWSSEGIDGVDYDAGKRELQFKTLRLAPFAFMVSKTADLPYKRWNLRCSAFEKAILDVETKRSAFTFEIGSGYVKLIDRKDPEMEHLVDKEMHPGVILQELRKCGVNLLPTNADGPGADVVIKDSETEERALLDIMNIDALAFRSSCWNQGLGAKRIAMKIRENIEYDREFFEDYEIDWVHGMWYPNKVGLVKMREDKEECNEELLKDHVTHSQLHIALADMATETARTRMSNFNQIYFIDTLKKMLRLLRLFSFS